MSKLKNREKVILGLVVVSLLYFAFTFSQRLGRHSDGSSDGMNAETREFISGLKERIKGQSPSDKIIYAIQAAEAEWSGEPFDEVIKKQAPPPPRVKEAAKNGTKDGAKEEAKEAVKEPEKPQPLALEYTGFLEMNGHKIAVIGGVEYEAGESIHGKPFTVEDIDSSKVVVKGQPGGEEETIYMKKQKGE